MEVDLIVCGPVQVSFVARNISKTKLLAVTQSSDFSSSIILMPS